MEGFVFVLFVTNTEMTAMMSFDRYHVSLIFMTTLPSSFSRTKDSSRLSPSLVPAQRRLIALAPGPSCVSGRRSGMDEFCREGPLVDSLSLG